MRREDGSGFAFVQVILLFCWFHAVSGVQLRGKEDFSLIGSPPYPTSFISLSRSATLGKQGTDWWLWILIVGFVCAVGFITFTFRQSSEQESSSVDEKRVIVNGTIVSCQQIVTGNSLAVNPTLLGITIRGRMPTGDYVELFNNSSGHYLADVPGNKFNWEDPDLQWIISQPLASSVITEMSVSVEQYSETGGLNAILATATVRLKPPVVGEDFSPRTVPHMVELMSATSAGVWGTMELSIGYTLKDPSLSEGFESFSVAQKQIVKKLKVVRPLFLASHSLAVGLVILDSFFGIRFLFSGCFASSVHSIVSAGLIALLSIPMAAEWGQLHYHLPSWMIKVGKLNSQFKATVLLVCAVPQSVLSGVTGSKTCSPFFSTLGTLTLIDFVLFSALFVQAEANGHIGALLHANCFKRPLPPAGADKLVPKEKDSKKFLASQISFTDNSSSLDAPPAVSPASRYATTRKERRPTLMVNNAMSPQ